MEITKIINEIKSGNKSVVGKFLFKEVYYSKNDLPFNGVASGLKELRILHPELRKNFYNLVYASNYDRIDMDIKKALFITGFYEAVRNIKVWENEKSVFAYIHNAIENQFLSEVNKRGEIDKEIPLNSLDDEDEDEYTAEEVAAFYESALQKHNKEDNGNNLAARFWTEYPIKERLTPKQKELLDDIAYGKDNATIAEERKITVQAVSQHRNNIKKALSPQLATFAELNKRAATRLTSEVIQYLEHFDLLSDVLINQDNSDELMFYDVFKFVKKEFRIAYNNNIASESKVIENLSKNKYTDKYTMEDLLFDHLPVKAKIKTDKGKTEEIRLLPILEAMFRDDKYTAEMIEGKPQKFKFEDTYLTATMRKRFATYILKALNEYLHTYKQDIEDNIKQKVNNKDYFIKLA